MSDKVKIPKCQVPGCKCNAANAGRRKDGSIRYRKSNGHWICSTHHQLNYAKKNGYKSAGGLRTKRLQEAWDAGFATRYEYNEAETIAKAKELGFATVEDYRQHRLDETRFGSYEKMTKQKTMQYFRKDLKQGKLNEYSSAQEMYEDLVEKVYNNLNRNSGVLRSEITNVILDHKKKSFFQMSFDRIDNSLGHSRKNIRIVEEPYNTMTKDKFNEDQFHTWMKACIKEILAIAV